MQNNVSFIRAGLSSWGALCQTKMGGPFRNRLPSRPHRLEVGCRRLAVYGRFSRVSKFKLCIIQILYLLRKCRLQNTNILVELW